jgi:hypothetical protein
MQSKIRAANGVTGAWRIGPFLAVLAIAGVVLPASRAEAQRFTTNWYPQRGGGEQVFADSGQPYMQGPVMQGSVVQGQPGGMVEGDMQMDPSYGGSSPRGSCASCDSCGDDMGPRAFGRRYSSGASCGREGFFVGPDGTILPNGFYFRGEYLMWWNKAGSAPPLVTTSPVDTPQAQAGVLGQTGTSILFGNSLDFGTASGGRFTAGVWLAPCELSALEATYFFLGNTSAKFNQTSDGTTILARPFFNVETAAQDAVLIAYPHFSSGTVNVSASTELQSADLVFRRAIAQYPNMRFDVLAGYRYAQLHEDLTVNTSLTSPLFAPGTTIQTFDSFGVSNQFNGAELGVSSQSQTCGWTLGLMAKLALGGTRSVVTIDGTTTTTGTPTTAGGLLAQPTNLGRFERNDFTVIPELGVTLGYELTPRVRATVGYTLFYWSNVARPGDQIDTNLNPSQFSGGTLAGMPSPEFRLTTTDYWAQGLSFGFDCRF